MNINKFKILNFFFSKEIKFFLTALTQNCMHIRFFISIFLTPFYLINIIMSHIPQPRKLIKDKTQFSRASANLVLELHQKHTNPLMKTQSSSNIDESRTLSRLKNVELKVPNEEKKNRRSSDADTFTKKDIRLTDEEKAFLFINKARKLFDSFKKNDFNNDYIFEDELYISPKPQQSFTITYANSVVIKK